MYDSMSREELIQRIETLEHTLSESEIKYENVMKTVPCSISIVRVVDNRILEVNEFFTLQTGYTRKEAIGKTVEDLNLWIDPADSDRIYRILERNGEVNNYQVTFRNRNGISYDSLLSCRFLEYRGEFCTITAVIDVTERKRVEKEKQESEEKYRLLAENAMDIIWTMDLRGVTTYVSPSVNRFGGYTDKDFMAGTYYELLSPESRQILYEKTAKIISRQRELAAKGARVAENTHPLTLELEYLRKDGGTIWTETVLSYIRDENGKPTGVLGVTRDVNDRKNAEEALKESELRYRTLFQNAPVGIGLINPSGWLLTVNDHLIDLTGFAETELYENPINEYFTAYDMWNRITNMIDEKGVVRNFEVKFKRKNNDFFYANLNLTPITLGGENFIFMVVNDISEIVKMSQEKHALEMQLQRAQKMEAIGTLAGGVAHDLNNILSGVTSYPELLLLDIPEKSPIRKPLLTIRDSGEKAKAIVQDLLTLARRGVMVSEVVKLNQVVSGYLNSPEFATLKGFHPEVDIEANLDPDLLNIIGSPVHLTKTVMNLVSNAAEAISGPGRVRITTGNRYVDAPVRGYDQVKKGEYVILTISDTGIGITPEDQEKIFEPFYTKKVMGRSGTGLGMAVVWGTVKDHNGYLDIKSEKNKGTQFTLYFAVTRKQIAEKEHKMSFEDFRGNGETILIVDDVKEQREIASGILSRLGYCVSSVSSGEKAVAHLKNHPVDLLILDMIMAPGMDGLDTYKKILEMYPGQRAILASGFSETKQVRKAQQLGAGSYIKKPYTLEKIGVSVKHALHCR